MIFLAELMNIAGASPIFRRERKLFAASPRLNSRDGLEFESRGTATMPVHAAPWQETIRWICSPVSSRAQICSGPTIPAMRLRPLRVPRDVCSMLEMGGTRTPLAETDMREWWRHTKGRPLNSGYRGEGEHRGKTGRHFRRSDIDGCAALPVIQAGFLCPQSCRADLKPRT